VRSEGPLAAGERPGLPPPPIHSASVCMGQTGSSPIGGYGGTRWDGGELGGTKVKVEGDTAEGMRRARVSCVVKSQYQTMLPTWVKQNAVLDWGALALIKLSWRWVDGGTRAFEAREMKGPADSPLTWFYDEYFKRLYEHDSTMRSVLKGSLMKQSKVLMGMVKAITGLEEVALGDGLRTVHSAADANAALGIAPCHYDVLGQCLLETLERCSGSDVWSADVAQAWVEALSVFVMVALPRAYALINNPASPASARTPTSVYIPPSPAWRAPDAQKQQWPQTPPNVPVDSTASKSGWTSGFNAGFRGGRLAHLCRDRFAGVRRMPKSKTPYTPPSNYDTAGTEGTLIMSETWEESTHCASRAPQALDYTIDETMSLMYGKGYALGAADSDDEASDEEDDDDDLLFDDGTTTDGGASHFSITNNLKLASNDSDSCCGSVFDLSSSTHTMSSVACSAITGISLDVDQMTDEEMDRYLAERMGGVSANILEAVGCHAEAEVNRAAAMYTDWKPPEESGLKNSKPLVKLGKLLRSSVFPKTLKNFVRKQARKRSKGNSQEVHVQ
jgi:hemoglobin-like flavoprotein